MAVFCFVSKHHLDGKAATKEVGVLQYTFGGDGGNRTTQCTLRVLRCAIVS